MILVLDFDRMKMKEEKTQLEFYKTILRKVSFDSELFEKEFRKAIISLSYDDSNELKKWRRTYVVQKFQRNYIKRSS